MAGGRCTGAQKFQEDPQRDLVLFDEYFHGDKRGRPRREPSDGRRPALFATSTGEQFLELGRAAGAVEVEPARSGPTGGAARRRGP